MAGWIRARSGRLGGRARAGRGAGRRTRLVAGTVGAGRAVRAGRSAGVGAVEAAALEDHADRAEQFAQRTGTLRALGQARVAERLDRLEPVVTFLAGVLIGGHRRLLIGRVLALERLECQSHCAACVFRLANRSSSHAVEQGHRCPCLRRHRGHVGLRRLPGRSRGRRQVDIDAEAWAGRGPMSAQTRMISGSRCPQRDRREGRSHR